MKKKIKRERKRKAGRCREEKVFGRNRNDKKEKETEKVVGEEKREVTMGRNSMKCFGDS